MDEDDYDEVVRDKAKELYVGIVVGIASEVERSYEDIDENLSVEEYDDIISDFCGKIMDYTA